MEKERINVAEILRNCQAGMNLDCVCFENVVFNRVDDKNRIRCFVGSQRDEVSFNEYGCLNGSPSAKCVIFPVGKNSWEGFVPPCKFKAGDVLVSQAGNIVLFSHIDSYNCVKYHCIIPIYGSFRIEEKTSTGVGRYNECVLANEEQRQKMYNKIKCSGYKYNQQFNKLEKLNEPAPKFKVGDVIINQYFDTATITEVDLDNERYGYELSLAKGIGSILFSEESNWELVPDKFNITTLIPFESRVLVRSAKTGIWRPAIWGFYSGGVLECYSVLGGISWNYCIPYEGNEHLLGTTNDCDDFYKTWPK